MGVKLPGTGACAALIVTCDGRELVLELLDGGVQPAVEEGSVVDVVLSLSWGIYKWLCLVCSWDGRKAEVQLLDAPMFIQRRLDPRVGVGVPAEVRTVRSDKVGIPYRAEVSDLSHGGLKLKGAKPLRAGDTVEVTMDLSATASQEGPVTLTGRVVMAYPSAESSVAGSTDAHVCFTDGQETEIACVDRFVAQQLTCRWEA